VKQWVTLWIQIKDILKEISMICCETMGYPMDTNKKLVGEHREVFYDPKRYRRLLGNLCILPLY